MVIKFKLSKTTERRIAFSEALTAALFLSVEDSLFPLATYHPSSAATAAFQWNSLKKDAEQRVASWAQGRTDLLERVQHGAPTEDVAREVLKLNILELQYLNLAANAVPMLNEITEDYTKVLALGGEPYERFRGSVSDYRAIADVSPAILRCQKEVDLDQQRLVSGLKDRGSSEKVSDALVATTTGLASLIRSARAGQLPHCGDQLVRFEESYGRLVVRQLEVVEVLREHAEKQQIAKRIFHWFWIAVLLFWPWLPEKARKLKEVFAG